MSRAQKQKLYFLNMFNSNENLGWITNLHLTHFDAGLNVRFHF